MATVDKNFRVKNSTEAKSYITYTTAGVTPAVGEIAWDIDNETIAVGLDANVTLQVGQEQLVRVKNNSGSVAIPKFTFVMFAGATGDTVTVSPAVTDGTNPHEYMVGITAEEIPADGFGFVTQYGFINNVNTNSYTLGQLLYPDPAVAGGFTTTRPTAPAFDVAVAAVTKVNASAGRVLVRMINGETLNTLHDVQITTAANNNLLVFSTTANTWINQTADQSNLVDKTSTQTITASKNFIGTQTLTNATTNANALIVRAISSQTANIVEIKSGAGTTVSYFDSFGVFYNTLSIRTPSGRFGATNISYGSSLDVVSQNSTTTAMIVRALSTQTANLIEVQNAAGTALARITSTGAFISTADITGSRLLSSNATGDEGGEIVLTLPVTNSSLSGSVTIDLYQNKLRFFETGGTNRGAYIDLTAATNGVGSNLLAGGSASNSFSTIAVSGQGNVEADSSSDTLTFVAGTFVSITTATASDSITFSASHSHAIDDLSDVTITSATTSQILRYNGTAWANATDGMGGYESASYYGPVHDANAGTSAAITEDVTYYMPFYVSQTTTFDRIGCRTASTFSGNATVRLGIYNNSTNRPDTLVLDAGTLSATASSTFYEITISQQLTPGWYWLAFNSQTNATTNTYAAISPVATWGYQNTATNFNRRVTREQTGVTGAFATAGTLNTGASTSAPGVLLRAV